MYNVLYYVLLFDILIAMLYQVIIDIQYVTFL